MGRLVACIALGFVVLANGAAAQQNQPIYPVYDGFLKNPDGSYSGHHCISSPVFCTAAVIQCVTTDRDATVLFTIADKSRAKLNPAQEASLEARLAEGRKAQPVQAAQRPVRSVEVAPAEPSEADLLKSPPRESRRRK